MVHPDNEPVIGEPDDDVEEIAEEVARHNRDPITRREALEQELASRGRSEEGEAVGDHLE
jgi:hypothetical protein